MKNGNVFICKRVMFYSPKDEDAFFEWIKKITSINHFEGLGDELYLYIEGNELPDQDLDDLIGLFYRYKIDMKQLRRFLNANNKEWFADKKKYWYESVFG